MGDVKRIENLDLEFELKHEEEERKRIIKGEEFDTITQEMFQRVETLEEDIKRIKQVLENLAKISV